MKKSLTKKQIEESFRSHMNMPFSKEGDDSSEDIKKMLKGTVTLEDVFNIFEVVDVPDQVKISQAFHELIVLQNVVDELAKKHNIKGKELDKLYKNAEKKYKADQKKHQEERKKFNEDFVNELKEMQKKKEKYHK